MRSLEQIAVAWQALGRTGREIGNAASWAPFLVLGAAQAAVLGLMWGFAHPFVSWAIAPMIARLADEGTLHYPELFVDLPSLYARLDVLIGATLGSVVVGAATLVFAARFRGLEARPGDALRQAVSRAATLMIASLPFNFLAVALSYGLEWLVESRHSSGATRRIVFAVVLGGSVLLQAVFFYVAALVMLEGRSVIQAWAGLPRTWSRGFASALMLGVLLVLPLLPLSQILQRSVRIVERGQPELVGTLLAVQLVIGLCVWFLLSGSATLVYLTSIAEPPDDGESVA